MPSDTPARRSQRNEQLRSALADLLSAYELADLDDDTRPTKRVERMTAHHAQTPAEAGSE
jgi:hypothetical protein